MAPPENRRANRRKRPLTRVSAIEFWRDAAGLLRSSSSRLLAVALPFGMVSIWFEQSILGLFPRVIKDQRAAALLAFYGSMAIAYVAYAAIAAVTLPHWTKANSGSARVLPFNGNNLASVLTIAVVAPLGTIAGLAAALVPGIIVWLSWVVATPMAATSGEAPFVAMRRSARLTWGSRRSLFYVFATVQVGVFVISAINAVAMGQPVWAPLDDPKPLSVLEGILGGLVETLQLAVSGAVCSVAYARLGTAEVRASEEAGT